MHLLEDDLELPVFTNVAFVFVPQSHTIESFEPVLYRLPGQGQLVPF